MALNGNLSISARKTRQRAATWLLRPFSWPAAFLLLPAPFLYPEKTHFFRPRLHGPPRWIGAACWLLPPFLWTSEKLHISGAGRLFIHVGKIQFCRRRPLFFKWSAKLRRFFNQKRPFYSENRPEWCFNFADFCGFSARSWSFVHENRLFERRHIPKTPASAGADFFFIDVIKNRAPFLKRSSKLIEFFGKNRAFYSGY